MPLLKRAENSNIMHSFLATHVVVCQKSRSFGFFYIGAHVINARVTAGKATLEPSPSNPPQIRFVAGKSPVLIIYDKESGEVEETIALDKLKIEEVKCSGNDRIDRVGWFLRSFRREIIRN